MSVQSVAGPSTPRLPGWLTEAGNALVDLLFPPRCVECDGLGSWFCTECLDGISLIEPPLCFRCGLPIPSLAPGDPLSANGATVTCRRCKSSLSGLDGLRCVAFHGDVLRRAISQFKYEDLRVLAVPFGKLMAQRWSRLRPAGFEPDAIVPVALHPSRQTARGFNQAALLASELSGRLGPPVVPDILERVKDTLPQVGLGSRERQQNVQDAFVCKRGELMGRQVLLVDDVCTTGSTLEAAASALRDGGVVSVWAYTLARAA